MTDDQARDPVSMTLLVAAGFTTRPLSLADTYAVHALMATYEQALLGETISDLEDFEGDFARPSFHPARDDVLVHDRDDLIAWAEVYLGRRATVVVHPDYQGQGIGGVLADWAVRRASEVGSNRVGQTVPDADTTAADLLSARAWSRLYTSWVLELPPGSEIASRPLPDGYRLRPYRPGHEERAAYEVIEQAFDEWPDRDPTSYEDWAPPVLQRKGFEPWQLMLAVTGDGRVVGACHLVVSRNTGWVN